MYEWRFGFWHVGVSSSRDILGVDEGLSGIGHGRGYLFDGGDGI